jgi:hypothetical protein
MVGLSSFTKINKYLIPTDLKILLLPDFKNEIQNTNLICEKEAEVVPCL